MDNLRKQMVLEKLAAANKTEGHVAQDQKPFSREKYEKGKSEVEAKAEKTFKPQGPAEPTKGEKKLIEGMWGESGGSYGAILKSKHKVEQSKKKQLQRSYTAGLRKRQAELKGEGGYHDTRTQSSRAVTQTPTGTSKKIPGLSPVPRTEKTKSHWLADRPGRNQPNIKVRYSGDWKRIIEP